MNTRKKAFIIGLVFLIGALLSITVLPVLLKHYTPFNFSQYIFAQIEFFLLFWCACLYAYSSRYYRYQIYSILGALMFYIMFSGVFG